MYYTSQKRKPRASSKGIQDVQIIIYPKIGWSIGRTTSQKRKSRSQTGGFLNRYEFAYIGRDTVIEVGKIAPKIINQATGEINKIAQEKIVSNNKVWPSRNWTCSPKNYKESDQRSLKKHHLECWEILEKHNFRRLKENYLNKILL